MTGLEKLCRANRWRIKPASTIPSMIASTEADGWNGHFLVPVEGDLWHVVISDCMGWKHLSIRNAQRLQLPSWYVLARIKELFFGDDDWAVQFFPAKNAQLCDDPARLDLWMPLNEELPHPQIALV